MKSQPISLQDALSKYLNYMCFSEKYTAHTCLNYVSDLNQFFESYIYGKFIYKPSKSLNFSKKSSKKGPIPSPTDLNLEVLNQAFKDFKPYLSQVSATSRKRKVSTYKGFTKWCLDSEWIDSDPGQKIPSIKTPERLPSYLNLDETLSFFETLKKDYKLQPDKYFNEYLCLLFLYACGLRISEACHIEKRNIDLSQKRILILGKGKKERFAILPQFACPLVTKAYTRAQEQNYKFIYGQKALVPRTVANWIKKRALKANIHKPVHPHMFRHSYATHLLRENTDLRHLQELLGHSSLASTQTYAHLDRDKLLQSLESFHPLSKKKG